LEEWILPPFTVLHPRDRAGEFLRRSRTVLVLPVGRTGERHPHDAQAAHVGADRGIAESAKGRPLMENGAFGWSTEGRDVFAGSAVEVRTRYLAGQWAHGYEVAEVLPDGCRVRRRGSQEVLADVFTAADLRPYSDR